MQSKERREIEKNPQTETKKLDVMYGPILVDRIKSPCAPSQRQTTRPYFTPSVLHYCSVVCEDSSVRKVVDKT